MKGEWIQADSGTWHLIWAEEGEWVTSWCNRTFAFDEPRKPGAQLDGWGDILHDECVRKAEEP